MTQSIFSYGGGRQSTAVLVLQAQGKLPRPFDKFVFANVGDNAEKPDVLDYYHEHAVPFAEANQIHLEEIRWNRRNGFLSLRDYIDEFDNQIPIPVRFPGTGPTNRKCTNRWKIEPVARLHASLGATEAQPGRLGLGISTDEMGRMRTEASHPWQTLDYPLIDIGLSAADCVALVEEAGLPTPPGSCCYFCPFQRESQWRQLGHDQPDMLNDAISLEKQLSERSVRLGKGRCWIGPGGPLPAVLAQETLFDPHETDCSGGSCFT